MGQVFRFLPGVDTRRSVQTLQPDWKDDQERRTGPHVCRTAAFTLRSEPTAF